MDEKDDGIYNGGGLKGPIWALFGVLTGAVAKYVTNGPGGLGGIFGGAPAGGPGAPVTREVLDLTTENAVLKASIPQVEINAKQSAEIACLKDRVGQLFSMTQLSIPNGNLNPGYGSAVVTVAPPVPPAAPDVATLAAAIAAQLQKSGTTSASNG